MGLKVRERRRLKAIQAKCLLLTAVEREVSSANPK